MQKATLFIAVCATLLPSLALAEQPIQEGLWEYTTQMHMPGLPAQAMTQRICLQRQDIEAGPVPKDPQCQIKNYKLSGQTATWQIECQGPDKMSGEGRITFKGNNAYEGESRMRIQPRGAAPMEMQQRFSARRIGNCK